MAALVDASSPANTNVTAGGSAGIALTGTSASFTPADGHLVVIINTDTQSPSGTTPVLTMSNNGTALTWTTRVERKAADSGGTFGYAVIATAPVSGRSGLTVTCSISGHSLSSSGTVGSMKVYVVTGLDATTPFDTVGASNEGSTTSNAFNTSSLTPGDTGLLFVGATDWNQLGTPVASSNLTDDRGDIAGHISYQRGYRTCTSGVGVTGALDAFGASAADWNWVQLIARQAAAGAATSLLFPRRGARLASHFR